MAVNGVLFDVGDSPNGVRITPFRKVSQQRVVRFRGKLRAHRNLLSIVCGASKVFEWNWWNPQFHKGLRVPIDIQGRSRAWLPFSVSLDMNNHTSTEGGLQ
jgi:hypothetical protein